MSALTKDNLPSEQDGGTAPVEFLVREFKRQKVSSFLLAAILLLGLVVTGLIALLIASRLMLAPVPTGVQFIEVAGEEGAFVPGRPLGIPGVDLEPTETLRTDTSVLELLAASAQNLEEMALNPEEPLPGEGQAGSGLGKTGTGTGTGVIPPEQRWTIVYDPGESVEEYARKLDYFGIELAVAAGVDQLLYLSHFSTNNPTKRVAPADREKRLYWAWLQADRRKGDVELLRKANVAVPEGMIVQFVPEKTEQTLARLETTYRGRNVKEIRSTRFGIRKTGSDYNFYVISQQYRK